MNCGVLYTAVKISVLQLYVSIWMNVINIVEKKEALEVYLQVFFDLHKV